MINQEVVHQCQEWHTKTLEMLKASAKRYRVHQTGALQSSIEGNYHTEGHLIKMTFRHLIQGSFVDMGARKGIKANTKKDIRKLWVSRIIYGRMNVLSHLLRFRMIQRIQISLNEIFFNNGID